MADALFPFPSPSFVFVHRVKLISNTSTEPEIDDNGWPIEASASSPGRQVKGYVSSPSYRDAASGLRVDAVVLVHRDEIPVRGDLVNVPAQPGLLPALAGLYKVDQVRPNASHTRLLVMRNDTGGTLATGSNLL